MKTPALHLLPLLAAVLAAASARAATDINISSYYNGSWNGKVNGGSIINGSQIAAAPTSGDTASGINFGDWTGHYVAVGPETSGSQSITLGLNSTVLSTRPSVNALFNTFYGVAGAVNATITFTNTAGATASFSLVGNQTVRDYNTNTFTNDLQGYNTNAAYGSVTAQNWWNNSSSGGGQRLDVATFVLPTSWAGTDLASMTLTDSFTSTTTDDIVLSALQVSSVVPEPSTWVGGLGVVGLLVVSLLRRRRAC